MSPIFDQEPLIFHRGGQIGVGERVWVQHLSAPLVVRNKGFLVLRWGSLPLGHGKGEPQQIRNAVHINRYLRLVVAKPKF